MVPVIADRGKLRGHSSDLNALITINYLRAHDSSAGMLEVAAGLKASMVLFWAQ